MSSGGPIPSSITNMNSKWKNWWIRGFFSVAMVTMFVGIIYLGPIILSLLVSEMHIFWFLSRAKMTVILSLTVVPLEPIFFEWLFTLYSVHIMRLYVHVF